MDRYCEQCDETSETAFDGGCVHYWRQAAMNVATDPNDGEVTMRCMLAKCIEEAVKLAIIDCVGADQMDARRASHPDESWEETFAHCDAERMTWLQDIYKVPHEWFCGIDPGALARNVSCRLIGYGGWVVNGVYSGNGTIRDVMEATFQRPDQDVVAEMAFDMGLRPTEGGLFTLPEAEA